MKTNNNEVLTVLTKALSRNGTVFARVDYISEVKPSAKNKHITITKHCSINTTLFATINDANVYARALAKTANKIEGQNINLEEIKIQDNWFTHDNSIYSLVHHKTNGNAYLYCHVNKALSREWYIDGIIASEEQVAELLTPSEYKKQFEFEGITVNKANDVVHLVVPRVIKVENIVGFKMGEHTI